jgi:hypothetical protein
MMRKFMEGWAQIHTSSHKTAVVLHALVCATLWLLLLVLLRHLGRLTTHLPGTGQ